MSYARLRADAESFAAIVSRVLPGVVADVTTSQDFDGYWLRLKSDDFLTKVPLQVEDWHSRETLRVALASVVAQHCRSRLETELTLEGF